MGVSCNDFPSLGLEDNRIWDRRQWMDISMDKPLFEETETAFQAVDLGSMVQMGEPPRYGAVKRLGINVPRRQ